MCYNKLMNSILFVCLGNICRSPAAEGILLHLAGKLQPPIVIYVESCGLGDWHTGNLPDERMRKAAELRGIVLTSRAQAFRKEFFDTFDYILAADNKVLHQLQAWADKANQKAKIHLMSTFGTAFKGAEIPDPYYGEHGQFELVMDMLEDACRGLLEHLKEKG